jgi:hypothetical protein
MAAKSQSDPYAGMGERSWSNYEIIGPRRRRHSAGAVSGITIFLDNTTILDTATIGSLVGNLSVSGGTGSYTFTLVSNPGGLFSIAGSQLKVAAALSAGSAPISIKADNGAGSITTVPFIITIRHIGAFVPTYELLGF